MSVTRADLLRAQSFVRRRMLAAVAYGVPDVSGRGVSPLRSVTIGAALSGVVLAGAFATGRFTDRPPQGWTDPGTLVTDHDRLFVVDRANGAPVLTPVPNRVSARLVTGSRDLKEVAVSGRRLRQVARGQARGIVAAPHADTWKSPTRWTACIGAGVSGGVVETRLGARPKPVGLAARGTDGSVWLVARSADGDAQRFRVDPGHRAVVELLGLTPIPVEDRWLALFDEGPEIRTVAAPGAGRPSVQVPGARIGDVLATGQGFVVVQLDGPHTISPFAASVHEARTGRPATLTEDNLAGVAASTDPSSWPRTFPAPGRSGCAALTPGSGSDAVTVDLVASPERRSADTSPGEESSPAPAQRGSAAPTVTTPVAVRTLASPQWLMRRGATAHEVSAPEPSRAFPGETVVLVDEFGTCYPLLGDDTTHALGIKPAQLPEVPTAWLDLLPTCHVLSRERALASSG